MRNVSKILSVIDPTTKTQPAMLRAAWLAKKTGAELELVICYYNEYLSGDRLFDSPSLEKARSEVLANEEQLLEELATPLRKDGLVVKTTALWDHPLHEGIVRCAIDSGADIVFKDTHHHSALVRAILSNTDWSLIRTCPVPLWLVKSRDVAATPTIIAAIDPMNEHDKPAALDDEILQLSRMLGGKLGGRCARVSFLRSAHRGRDRHGERVHTRIAAVRRDRKADARRPPETLPRDHVVSRHRRCARPPRVRADPRGIAGAREQINADLVVMGAVARNRWKRLFIGATAERTLEHLPCDLLIVKPDWFHTPVEQTQHEAA